MIVQTFILFIALFSCQEQKIKTAIKPKITKVVSAKRPLSNFAGNFAGTHNQKEIFVTLKAVPRTSKLTGVYIMDGKEATISATESSDIKCSGRITENDTKKRITLLLKLSIKNCISTLLSRNTITKFWRWYSKEAT